MSILCVGCASLFDSPTSPSNTDTDTTSPNTNTNTETLNTSGYANEVIVLTNMERRAPNNCGPGGSALKSNIQLTQAAQDHSKDMDENNYFSHTGRDGSSHLDRARRAGYSSSFVGENIASGQRSPNEVMQSWMSSPDHCENIMRAEYRDIGVGYANGLWVMMLGRG